MVRTSPRKYVTAVNVAETLEENYRAAALLQPHLPATGGVAPSCRHRGCVRQLPNTLLIPRGVIYYSEKHAVDANLLRVRDCMPIKLTVVEKTAVGPINLPASLTFKRLGKKNIIYVTVQIMTFWHMWKTTHMLSETGSMRFKKHICSIWSKPDRYNFLCYSFLHTNSNSFFVCLFYLMMLPLPEPGPVQGLFLLKGSFSLPLSQGLHTELLDYWVFLPITFQCKGL